MQVNLSGLRVLVISSTKGIGRAVAEALAENGAEVAINGGKSAEVDHKSLVHFKLRDLASFDISAACLTLDRAQVALQPHPLVAIWKRKVPCSCQALIKPHHACDGSPA
jgi:NAD(P)-dependent dehydrogenase (short-subunit alcohol dehydrogenase family)